MFDNIWRMGLLSWFYLKSEEKKVGNNFPPKYDVLDKPKDLSKINIKLLSIPNIDKIYEIIGYDEIRFGQIFYIREAHPNPSDFSIYKTFIKEDVEKEFIDLTIEGEGHFNYEEGAIQYSNTNLKEAFNIVADEIADNNKWVWTEHINLGSESDKQRINKATDSFEYDYLLGNLDE